jgi:hypothetical protein
MRLALLPWGLSLALPFSLLGALLVVPSPIVAPPVRAALVRPPVAKLAEEKEEKAVAGDDDLVDKVRKAVDEGVSFLKSQQRKTDGSWEVGPTGLAGAGNGGWTALALLALLNAGVKPSDEAVQKGLAYLRKVPPDRTYVTGLQTMVFCFLGEKVDHERIRRNVKAILRSRMSDGWTYNLTAQGGRTGLADFSNTQYALLGLHEAIQTGVAKVDDKTLREIRTLFTRTQTKAGGWGYRPSTPAGTMTMTTAGLCNLTITGLDLARGKEVLLPDGSAKHCGEYADNDNVTRALAWVGGRFPARLTAGNAVDRFGSPFYCLYGIERAGRLTGQRYFGGHDWYEVGCRFLVETQKADGSWSGSAGRATFDHWPVIATSFSLLFLSKGRTPILISKMAYGDKDDTGWNNKRSDVKHLVEFASRELFKGKPLAWQAFDVRNIDAATDASRRKLAAELLQSPIVYFNGHDLAPRDKEAEVLREYAANGGFILAEACCGRKAFDRDFRRLMKEVFPDADLQPLEAEHPVWLASGKFAVSAKEFPLLGIKQGCKTVCIYSPRPIAGYWEGNNQQRGSRSRKAFELGANIIAYATGLEPPRQRGMRVEITAETATGKPKRGYLQVGQLRHEGDWRPAPRAMRNLMVEARKVGLDVVLKAQPVFPSDEAVLDFRFLYMHGRNKFTAKKEDLKSLKFNLEHGGMLFADACCGGTLFDGAFRAFVKELFGEKVKLEAIPVTDELYGAGVNGGEAIRTVRRRTRVAGGNRVDPSFKELPPALEGVKHKGRWVVVYSPADIGCALENPTKATSPDCLGHDPGSALKLARAVLLYALKK